MYVYRQKKIIVSNVGPCDNVPILCNNSKIRSSFPSSSNTTLSALPQSPMGSPANPSQLIPNDQTNITDCASTYSFFSLNVRCKTPKEQFCK